MFWRFIPNALTCTRIGLALAFVLVPTRARLAILAAALVTEVLDGMLARRFHSESRTGRLLDPIADKILFAAVVTTLLVEDRLSWLELIAAGSRDLIVLLGAGWLALAGRWRGFLRMKPSALGKITTGLQYVVVFVAVIEGRVPWPIVAFTFVAGTLAGAQSAVRFVRNRAV